MDSTVMPEVIPMWISGFDTIMPETRRWPRPIPRFGGNISITIGSPLTSVIQPMVNEWRGIAAGEKGTVGVGGEWDREGTSPPGEAQREVRDRGDLAGGKERDVRVRIAEVLQEAVRKLGVEVETEEGGFDRGEWSQSTPRRGGKMEERKLSEASQIGI